MEQALTNTARKTAQLGQCVLALIHLWAEQARTRERIELMKDVTRLAPESIKREHKLEEKLRNAALTLQAHNVSVIGIMALMSQLEIDEPQLEATLPGILQGIEGMEEYSPAYISEIIDTMLMGYRESRRHYLNF